MADPGVMLLIESISVMVATSAGFGDIGVLGDGGDDRGQCRRLDSPIAADFNVLPMRTSTLIPIGRFSSRSGLSIKALRLYAEAGLLVPARVDAANGYRYYSATQLPRAERIRQLRALGIGYAQLPPLLELGTDALAHEIRRHVGDHAQAERRLGWIAHAYLAQLQKEQYPMSNPITVRHSPALVVASVTRHVDIAGLDTAIRDGLSVLQGYGCPGQDVPFGVYHGPVNSEQRGPIEICVPARPGSLPAGDVVLRELPACRLVTIDVRAEQARFPAILSAYEAVCDWIDEQRQTRAGPPREYWLNTSSEQPVMQVCWPITVESQEAP
ncbi:MAG TPA: MerR family transcriptional regulator [Chitinolyticbacter sp.]|nr:MerR family transcriptional regulator [Chitinolyticbacter sp.]